MTYKGKGDVKRMSTDEVGEEYGELTLIADHGINKYNEPVSSYGHETRITELENEYRARPDAESLDAFIESAFETARDYGAIIQDS